MTKRQVDLSTFTAAPGMKLEHCPQCDGVGVVGRYYPLPDKACAQCGNHLIEIDFLHKEWKLCAYCAILKGVQQACKDANTVLDVGAGMGRYHNALLDSGKELWLLDAYRPYLEKADARAHIVNAEVLQFLPKVGPKEFDAVISIDFIEHLTKEDALLAIGYMKSISRGPVVLFTPKGVHPQEEDGYRMGGDHWQKHRSSWEPEDLEQAGFKVEVWEDFHRVTGKSPHALWATRI